MLVNQMAPPPALVAAAVQDRAITQPEEENDGQA